MNAWASGARPAGAMPEPRPSVVHLLAEAAAAAPEAEALVCGESRLAYAPYWSAVSAFAAELAALGARGGRVAVLLQNGLDHAIAAFAAQAAGAQLVPLNPAYTAYELAQILEDAAPAVLVHGAGTASLVAPLCAALRIEAVALGPLRSLAEGRAAGPPLPLPAPDALAILQYTGGTSGRPKGVNLTHRALATNVAQREALLPTRVDDRVLAMTPLFHSYATAMGLHLAARARACLVILERYRPELALAAVAAERATLFAGSPAIFAGVMAHEDFGRADLSSLRLCYSGSAALSEETLARWEAATGCPICEGYGQTEAGPVLTYNPEAGPRKRATVGVALPRTEVEIVDVETGLARLPQGATGEIRARGPQLMAGYRNRPEETAAALRGGWLYTGDIGSFDEDGYLSIRDRKKELVIVSGYNVYPREVEEVLFAHPGVHEAAVVGRPDARRGECLVAFLVAREGAEAGLPEAAAAHVGERLVRYKWPAEYRLLAALPRTAVGKVDKAALKREALA